MTISVGEVQLPDGGVTPDPPMSASVSVTFSEDALFYEEAYTNALGDVVGRRNSTNATLTCTVRGGPYGGTLSLARTGFDRLELAGGGALPDGAVEVAAGETLTWSASYAPLTHSAAEGDISAVATFAAANYGGASAVLTQTEGGVYQIRALASVAAGGMDERFYVWDADENEATGLKKAGDLKAIGVCDEQWQINLRNCAKAYLGSTGYAKSATVSAQYGFSTLAKGGWKCNAFVAHSIVRAGLTVPHNSHWLKVYPPVANDWANGGGISGWIFLGRAIYPQPGYVVGHPAAVGSGHCGILDFDDNAIAAGEHNVNRRYKLWLDGTSGFHKYSNQE